MVPRNTPFTPRIDSRSPGAPTAALEPADNDLRDLATRELSVLFADELGRRNDEWTHTIESVKKTLALLERTCETAVEKLAEHESQPSAALSRVVDALVAAATAEAEGAAQRARDEAEIEIERLEALVERTQAELAEERHTLKMAREAVEQEKTARKSAEAAHEKAQSVHQLVVSDLASQLQSAHAELKAERAQLSGLKQQLEAEQGERSKLVAAIQTVQRAVLLADSIGRAPDPTVLPREAEEGRKAPDTEAASATTHAADALPENRLKLVANAQDAEPHPELLEYVKQLLNEMETIYWADLQSGANAADVVDRLTANLKYARELFTRRLVAYDIRESSLFEQQITILMDSKPETSFARHLAIAAYEDSPAQTAGTPRRAEAS